MTQISRSALVNYSAQQMFDLVNQVEHYPEFLPGCEKTEVIERSDEVIQARLTLAKAGFRQSFVTRNQLTIPSHMSINLVEGPFKHFQGEWNFIALDEEASKVSLDLSFEVSSRIAGAALNMLFKQLAGMMVECFVKRAKQVYG